MSNRNKDYYLFNESIFLYVDIPSDDISFTYQIEDIYFFLGFSYANKEFLEHSGFGKNRKDPNPIWFRGYDWNWEEMSE